MKIWGRVVFPAAAFGLGFCTGGPVMEGPILEREGSSFVAPVERERPPSSGMSSAPPVETGEIREILRALDEKLEGLRQEVGKIASRSGEAPVQPPSVAACGGSSFGKVALPLFQRLAQGLDLDEGTGKRLEADLEDESRQVADLFRQRGVTPSEWEEFRRLVSLGPHRITAEEAEKLSDVRGRFQRFQEEILRSSDRFHYLSQAQRDRIERCRGGYLDVDEDGAPRVVSLGLFGLAMRDGRN